MKKIKYLCWIFAAALAMVSCSEDELDPNSIFNTEAPERNEFDNWILENYVAPYNVDLKYRFSDIESDLNYNVTPADYNKSIALAQLVKYLWLDVYDELTYPEFLPTYCPKVMHFVGSGEYESNGSVVLGTAEYAAKDPDEDFVETLATYVVYPDDQWQDLLKDAGETGSSLILQKLDLITTYLTDSWGIDIEALHDLVQERASHVTEMDWTTLK